MSGFFFMRRFDGCPVEVRLLENIASSLEFRGPDGAQAWTKGPIGGCFTWMRTGPPPQSKIQPVTLDERFRLWGDVRLYAQEELRKELAEHDPVTNAGATSEELLLQSWKTWGPASLEKVIGDFSFVLWDAREEIAWCARDFVGPRPFNYSAAENVFCCSNTLDVLQLLPELLTRSLRSRN